MVCKFEGCKLETYGDKEECILHCEKEIYRGTSPSIMDERNNFNEAFLNFIKSKIYKTLNENGFSAKTKRTVNTLNSSDLLTYFKKNLAPLTIFSKYYIYFPSIKFPWDDIKTSERYKYLIEIFEEIHFDRCHFYHYSLELNNKMVFFQDCTFENEWLLTNYQELDNADSVIYDNCIFKKNVTNSLELVEFSTSLFNNMCSFKNGFLFKNIKIPFNIFSNDPNSQNPSHEMEGNFKFKNCHFTEDQEIYLSNAENASFDFNECTFDHKFKIRGLETGNYEDDQDNKASLKSLKIINCKVANNDNTYIRIGFLKNCELTIKNLRNQANSEMNIGDCHFKHFQLTNFRNVGKFKLFKINTLEKEFKEENNKLFKIDNTSIGKTDFQSINLTSFEKVCIFDNILTEIDYTNMQWKEEITVQQFKKGYESAKKRDTYRSLKNVSQKNNDQPQALIFYAQEMDNHYKTTKFKKEKANKIALFFNKISNEFGMNWWRPIWILFIVSIIAYSFLIFSINGPCIYTTEIFSKYFIFLNPIHKTEFIGKGYWNTWSYFIDFVFRIISGYLIYQTIQAFRKFSRQL